MLISLLLILGAVLNMFWILEVRWPTGLSPVTASLSQWEAGNGRSALWWRHCFTGADICVGLAAVIALSGSERFRRWSWARGRPVAGEAEGGWAAMAIYALASAIADLCPPDPGRDAMSGSDLLDTASALGGRGLSRLAELVLSWGVHGLASVVAACALLVAMYWFTTKPRTRPGERAGAVYSMSAGYGRWLLLAQAIATGWLAVAILGDGPAGVAGRVELSGEAGWLVFLAFNAIGAELSPSASD